MPLKEVSLRLNSRYGLCSRVIQQLAEITFDAFFLSFENITSAMYEFITSFKLSRL